MTHLRIAAVPTLTLVWLALACSSHSLPREGATDVLLYVGFSRGHGGGFGVEVSSAGRLRVWGLADADLTDRLDRRELSSTLKFIKSTSFKEAVRILDEQGYSTRRGDRPGVGIGIDDREVGFPVCSNHPAPVAPEVKAIIDWANDLARKHFPAAWAKDLPTSACAAGEYDPSTVTTEPVAAIAT